MCICVHVHMHVCICIHIHEYSSNELTDIYLYKDKCKIINLPNKVLEFKFSNASFITKV